MPNALGKRAGALPADLDETWIACDLIQGAERPLGLGQQFAIQLGFELQQRIIDA